MLFNQYFLKSTKKGFSLLELSIVIAIIGLIIAGITAGASLVKSAQLRSVTSEYDQIVSAMNSFKLRYDAYPGDFIDANSYWAGCNSGASASDCNGDGDKSITNNASRTNNEYLRVW